MLEKAIFIYSIFVLCFCCYSKMVCRSPHDLSIRTLDGSHQGMDAGKEGKGIYRSLSLCERKLNSSIQRGGVYKTQMLVRGLQPPPSPPVLCYKGEVSTRQHLFVPIMLKTPPQSNAGQHSPGWLAQNRTPQTFM